MFMGINNDIVPSFECISSHDSIHHQKESCDYEFMKQNTHGNWKQNRKYSIGGALSKTPNPNFQHYHKQEESQTEQQKLFRNSLINKRVILNKDHPKSCRFKTLIDDTIKKPITAINSSTPRIYNKSIKTPTSRAKIQNGQRKYHTEFGEFVKQPFLKQLKWQSTLRSWKKKSGMISLRKSKNQTKYKLANHKKTPQLTLLSVMQGNIYEVRGTKAPVGEMTDHFRNCHLGAMKKNISRPKLKENIKL